jgi:hypothetical protein
MPGSCGCDAVRLVVEALKLSRRMKGARRAVIYVFEMIGKCCSIRSITVAMHFVMSASLRLRRWRFAVRDVIREPGSGKDLYLCLQRPTTVSSPLQRSDWIRQMAKYTMIG